MRKFLLASAMALAVSSLAGAADAAVSVLYRVDFSLAADRMAEALANPAYAVTTTAGDLSGFDLSTYDLVVYANQNSSVPSGDVGLLDGYVGLGGKLIYTTWTDQQPALGGDNGGTNNQTSLNVGPLFGGGSFAITNPGWGTFTRGLVATSGTVAGTYGDGSTAILVGNGGRTIWNGFLNDTLSDSQLYGNQLSYLSGLSSAVPEPATWAMMITGFGLAGSALRRRRSLALAA